MVSTLLELSLEAASKTKIWKYRRRTLQGLPPVLANRLLKEILEKGSLNMSYMEFEAFAACVTEVFLDSFKVPVGPEWIKALQYFRGLISVEIRNNRNLVDKNVEVLKPFAKKMSSIGFPFCTQLTGKIFKELLVNCVNLQELNLSGTRAFSKHGATTHIGEMKSLRNLSLESCGLKDSDCRFLTNLTNLSSLNLAGNKITQLCITGLTKFQELTKLNISWTHVHSIPDFRKLKELKMDVLVLKGGIVGEQKCEIDCLEELSVRNCTIVDNWNQIGDMLRCSGESLRRLDLHETPYVSILNLTTLKNITSLTLPKVATDSHLAQLSHMDSLKELALTDAQVTTEGLSKIKHLSKLEALVLTGSAVDDGCFDHISHLTALTRLELKGTKVSQLPSNGKGPEAEVFDEAGSENICHLPNLVRLDLLDTDWQLKKGFGQYFGSVKILSLGGKHLEGRGLDHLLELKNLEELHLEMKSIDRFDLKPLYKCTTLTSIRIVPAFAWLENWTEVLGSLYSVLPHLKMAAWSKNRVPNPRATSTDGEELSSQATIDERRRYSSKELLDLKGKTMDGSAWKDALPKLACLQGV
ncbi:hypothetical protein BSKO_09170 [Bryopsis sp. KO-2023]|nr:hypothetical protein BSKO_09170 [Bryopsis sp. KO-2023]